MKTSLIAYVSTIVFLLILDGTWLSIMTKRFYSPRLAHLTAATPTLWPAALFYILYAFGLVILIITPALQGHFTLSKIFLLGALLGLMAYGAYDFTNQATLKDWPLIVTVVDLLWGGFVTGTASTLAVNMVRLFS